jgi:hypothetical protein
MPTSPTGEEGLTAYCANLMAMLYASYAMIWVAAVAAARSAKISCAKGCDAAQRNRHVA